MRAHTDVMSHNVRVDVALRFELQSRAHFASTREARASYPALDAHFTPRMRVSVSEVRFSCVEAPPFRRHYVTRPVASVEVAMRAAGKKRVERELIAPDAAQRERESGAMVIDASTLALLEQRAYQGAYWAFMMTHALQGKKTDTRIGYSTNPLLTIYRHNAMLMGDRATSAAAPHWRADILVGTFASLAHVVCFCEDWVDGTRGKTSKRRHGHFLARINNKRIYANDVPAPPLARYLSQNAPRAYQEAHKRLCERARAVK